MKIDYIITNPPYNGTLYLDILEYLIKNCSDSEIVSVNPNQHLSNIIVSLGLRPKSSETIYEKYENKVYKHIKDIKSLCKTEFDSMFGIRYQGMGAIYHIIPNKTYDKYKTAFKDFNYKGELVYSALNKVIKKVIQEETIFNSKKYGRFNKGNLVAVRAISEAFINGYFLSGTSRKVYKKFKDYIIASNGRANEKHNKVLNFSTHTEALNYIEMLSLDFMKFYMRAIHMGIDSYFRYIPILDMTQKWTNEKLCEYYNVSKKEYKACVEWFYKNEKR